MLNQKTSENLRSSFGRGPSVMLSYWFVTVLLSVLTVPSQAAVECGSASWLTSPQGLELDAEAGSTRFLLEVTKPAMLVIESSKVGLKVELDGCGAGWGGRAVETTAQRRVLAFTEPGVYGLWLDGKGAPVQMHWIEVAAAPFEFRVWRGDQGFFVRGMDLYSLEQSGESHWGSRGPRTGPPGSQGRHLGQLMSFEADSFDGRATLRAEIGTGIHRSLGHRPDGANYMLKADVRVWNAGSPLGLDGDEDEQEVDPNEGGFMGTKPVLTPASLDGDEDEQEVDPNEGGFTGTKPGLTLSSLDGDEDEQEVDPNEGGFTTTASRTKTASLDGDEDEQEVDPNEGGFTLQIDPHGEHLILTVHWSGESCDAPADRRDLARQWIELLSSP